MPKKRPPRETWQQLRKTIWLRDGKECIRCKISVALSKCHCDHIQSGKLGSNKFKNLRILCRRCHVLRADFRHRGMTAAALRDGIIDANWRSQAWEDHELSN